MEKSKRRLKVFENITGGFKEEAASRVLEIRGVGDLTGLISNLRRYGEIQMADYSNFIYGIIIVSYYDIRVAKNVYFSLDPPYSIKFLNYNAEHDYVALTLDEYDDYGSLLATCGEIMSTSKFDTYITVHFYDIRSARNAFCTINKRNDYKTFRSELDTSVHSDSTSPSPYLLPLSTKSSNESIFEEHRIKKLNSEKDEKIFKIHLETIYNNKDTRTTLMIRNIPNKYTQSMLLEAINKKFANTYDIFYLPIDFKNKCNVGYGFINLKSFSYIPKLFKEFNGKRWEKFNSEKICELTYARIQGKQALLYHLQSSSVMSQGDSFKPVIIF